MCRRLTNGDLHAETRPVLRSCKAAQEEGAETNRYGFPARTLSIVMARFIRAIHVFAIYPEPRMRMGMQ